MNTNVNEPTFLTKVNQGIAEYLVAKDYPDPVTPFYIPANCQQTHTADNDRACYDYIKCLPNHAVLMLEAKIFDQTGLKLTEKIHTQNRFLRNLWECGVKVHYGYPKSLSSVHVLPHSEILDNSAACDPSHFCNDTDEVFFPNPAHESLRNLLDKLISDAHPVGEVIYGIFDDAIFPALGVITLLIVYNIDLQILQVLSPEDFKRMIKSYKKIAKQDEALSLESDPKEDELVQNVKAGIVLCYNLLNEQQRKSKAKAQLPLTRGDLTPPKGEGTRRGMSL